MRAHPWFQLLAALLVAAPIAAQPGRGPAPQTPCTSGKTADAAAVLLKVINVQPPDKKAVVAHAMEQPLLSPPSKQVAAPAGTGNATTLVNGASFPELLGLAFEDHLVNVSNGVTTLDLNLFSFKALISPEVLDKDTQYQEYSGLRKFGGSLSFGGKGDSFDRNGDGTADPALDAKNPADIVKWEVRYRFSGSRDRRETINADELFKVANADFVESTDQFRRFFAGHAAEIAALADSSECFDPQDLTQFARRTNIAEELRQIEASHKNLQDTVDAQNKKTDQSAIWTIVVGGLDRRKQFGPSQRTASLRGAKGGDDKGFTWNLDYSRVESFAGPFAQRSWKLGIDYSILILKGAKWVGKDGLKVAFSGADELYSHVPTATHDSVIKLNAKLDFPLTKTIKIPISVTWANHKDLLTSERDIRGHIGFTIDLSNPGKDK